jgi:integrase/recombinase XerD
VHPAHALGAQRGNPLRVQDLLRALYTQKTGVPVYTVLPDSVLRVLEATPRATDARYFWSGQGKRQTVIGDWQGKIKKFYLAEISKGLSNAVSHRLRDTFAVELLLAGVPIERGPFCSAIKACE